MKGEPRSEWREDSPEATDPPQYEPEADPEG